jgi:hypothetical protein
MGPEATTALMTLVAIKPLAAGDPARYAALASTLALLTGLMAVVAWLLRLGFFADLLSRPALVGYMAGVALIMIGDQLQRATRARCSPAARCCTARPAGRTCSAARMPANWPAPSTPRHTAWPPSGICLSRGALPQPCGRRLSHAVACMSRAAASRRASPAVSPAQVPVPPSGEAPTSMLTRCAGWRPPPRTRWPTRISRPHMVRKLT